MATFYLGDGGNDANNGTTYANRWETITGGATAARIAPGDTIRIMASPAPTSLGQNAQWTDGPLAPQLSNTSCSNTSPINVLAAAHGYVTGDTVIISVATGNTAANGVWDITRVDANNYTLDGSTGNGASVSGGNRRKINNAVVRLSSAVTQNIALCGNAKPNWTAANANVTCSIITSDFKEGSSCLQIAVGAGFTTGLAAYLPLASLDLSAYEQFSFWTKLTSGSTNLAFTLWLCSGTDGTSLMEGYSFNSTAALNQWWATVHDSGAPLTGGVNVQSIGLYIDTDNGAQTLLLDNLIACKASSAADSLNLTSLISKNTGSEAWFGIQSINGTRIMLDGPVNTVPGTSPQRGYSGTTENVTLYKREPIKTTMAASSTANVHNILDSGTSGNPITFSGGWNRTDMSTQTGETWWDGQNGFGNPFGGMSVRSFISVDKNNFARYYTMNPNGDDWTIGSAAFCSMSNAPLNNGGSRLTATTLSAVCCGGALILGPGAVVQTIARADSSTGGSGVSLGVGSKTQTITQANNNASFGVSGATASYVGEILAANGNASNSGYIPGSRSVVGTLVANNNSGYGVASSTSTNWAILGGATSGNGTGGVQITTGSGVLRNFTVNEATEVSGFTAFNDARVHSEKHDGTTGNHIIFCDGGLIQTQSSVVHGSATLAWKFSPTSTNRSQSYPLNLPVAQVACSANELVTISQWFRRDSTGLTMRLVCKGGQIAGVASDVAATMSAAANTWELLTLTFTPGEAGVVEIEAQAWGGTTYNGYVGEFSNISQA